MNENFETQVRVALDEKAHEVEAPDSLAERTLDAVRALDRETLPERWRARRDSRTPVTGYPRWQYAVAGVAAVVLLFAVGAAVTWPGVTRSGRVSLWSQSGDTDQQAGDTAADTSGSRKSSPRDVVAGQSSKSLSGTSQSQSSFDRAPTPKSALPPKVVRNADIEVSVRDFEDAWREANEIAERNGGYITNEDTEQREGTFATGRLTMRVPADKLDDTIKDLRELGTLAHLTTNARDVSAPVADLAARRKAAEAEEAQLLQLLDEAPSADEVINIRGRLNDVRADIESLKAKEAKYQQDIDYSTLAVTVTRSASSGAPSLGEGTFGRAIRTGATLATTILAGTIVLVGALLPLALIALLAWFVVRTVRRRTG